MTFVRRADPADAAAIAHVHVATWQRAYAGMVAQEHLDSLSVRERTESWRRALTDSSSGARTVVAEVSGRVVGFASVGPSRDADATSGSGELWALYVHPDHWGLGVGQALHAQSLVRLRAMALAGAGTSSAGTPSAGTPSAGNPGRTPGRTPCGSGATLWVLAANERARRFYEDRGWVADGTATTVWVGTARLDEVRYRLPAVHLMVGEASSPGP